MQTLCLLHFPPPDYKLYISGKVLSVCSSDVFPSNRRMSSIQQELKSKYLIPTNKHINLCNIFNKKIRHKNVFEKIFYTLK